MFNLWETARMSWTDPTTGEEAYVLGASFVGTPAYSYARGKYGAYGVTALNPDVMDLYVETVEENKYLYDGEWHEIEEYEETIKVRFWWDETLKVRMTRNGVLINNKEILEGVALDTIPFTTREIFEQDDAGKVYSLASAHDIRLRGVKEVGGEFNDRPSSNFFRVFTNIAEKKDSGI